MSLRLSCGHYYGETMLHRRVAGLILTETRYAPRVSLPRHCHEHAYFCLVRHGRYTEEYGNRRRDVGPLTVAFHPPEEVHAQQFADAEVWSFNVEIPPPWYARLGPCARLLGAGADFHGGELAHLGLRLYREGRQNDSASPLAIEALTLELLALAARGAAVREGPRPPRWLARVRERLHAEFADPPGLAPLAEEAGVHPVHLAGAFRRHFRCTAGEYVRRRRVDWAAQQLSRTAAPLAEVALEAGFADQSHFSRTFKRLVGFTPAAYRRLMRE